MRNNYNWWTDPENKKEVEEMSWWNHKENKEDYLLPISIIESEGVWVASCNDETKLVLGEKLYGCAQGNTKAEAIENLFKVIRFSHESIVDEAENYKKWAPFRKGNWANKGGTWFAIFGVNIYLRKGKGMKGGYYIPFTKLNISIYNEWIK